MSVAVYWSDTTFDGYMIASNISRRENRLDAVLRSGPPPLPIDPKIWHSEHRERMNTFSPAFRFGSLYAIGSYSRYSAISVKLRCARSEAWPFFSDSNAAIS